LAELLLLLLLLRLLLLGGGLAGRWSLAAASAVCRPCNPCGIACCILCCCLSGPQGQRCKLAAHCKHVELL
jgi:hypothetical protein